MGEGATQLQSITSHHLLIPLSLTHTYPDLLQDAGLGTAALAGGDISDGEDDYEGEEEEDDDEVRRQPRAS